MIVFRLISFMTRLIASFFFVFLLQIPFNGQTLESYLNRFGQKFFVTKTLQKVSDNGARIIKEWNKDENPQREITNKKSPRNDGDSLSKNPTKLSKPSTRRRKIIPAQGGNDGAGGNDGLIRQFLEDLRRD